MNIRTILYLLPIGLVFFVHEPSLAQHAYSTRTDSLLADGAIRKQTQSFYVKPIFEQYQSLVSVQGDGFSAPQSDLARKRDWGIRIGYNGVLMNWKPVYRLFAHWRVIGIWYPALLDTVRRL